MGPSEVSHSSTLKDTRACRPRCSNDRYRGAHRAIWIRYPGHDSHRLWGTHRTPRAKVGILQTSLGLKEVPVAASQGHRGPLARSLCSLHLWTHGVTKLPLGEHGTAQPRPGPLLSHRSFTSVITRLQEGAWDALWSLNLTGCHENFSMLTTLWLSLLKSCLVRPQMREKMLVNHLRRGRQDLSRKRRMPDLCTQHRIQGKPFYPILLGPGLKLGAGRLKLDLWSPPTVERSSREG